jgi:hypothetical protein
LVRQETGGVNIVVRGPIKDAEAGEEIADELCVGIDVAPRQTTAARKKELSSTSSMAKRWFYWNRLIESPLVEEGR